jgi:hypothetical protein
MQGIYTYTIKINHVPKEHRVAAIVVLLFTVLISLVPALTPLYLYVSTFRSMFIIIIIIIIIMLLSAPVYHLSVCYFRILFLSVNTSAEHFSTHTIGNTGMLQNKLNTPTRTVPTRQKKAVPWLTTSKLLAR